MKLLNNDYVMLALRWRVLIILGTTLLVAALAVPGFFEMRTLGVGMDRAATIGLVAVGMTVLLLCGQLDLSVGAVLAVSGIVTIMFQEPLGPVLSAGLGLAAGALCGAINAFLVVGLKMNSLVATLATMIFFRAVAHWLTGSEPLSGPDPLFGIGLSRLMYGVISVRTLLFIVLIVLLHVWLTRTVPGRNMFAVGSNPDSATASGVRSNRYLTAAFIFGGFMAGFAGVVQSLNVNTGSPVFGETTLIAVIAAVVIGGTRLEGGKGSALGTLGGVFTMGALTTAMEYQSVPAYVQQIVTGLILLLLILLDRVLTVSRTREKSLGQILRDRTAPNESRTAPQIPTPTQ